MPYQVRMVPVWAVDVRNRPGLLARILESLTNAGAQLEFIVGRRVSENTSRVFIAPLKGDKQLSAAADLGLIAARGLHSVRIDGPDRAGLGADLTRALASHEINIRGISASTIGRRSVIYLAFESPGDADRAAQLLVSLLRRRPATLRAAAPAAKRAARTPAKKAKAAKSGKSAKNARGKR